MPKKVSVKPHLRKGKLVAGHARMISDASNISPQGSVASRPDLKNVVLGLETSSGVVFDNHQFNKQGLDQKKLFEHCVFRDCSFTSTDLTGRKFVDCDFDNCVFVDADLSDATLDGCLFTQVDFENTEYGVRWMATKFDDCRFDGGSMKTIVLEDGSFNKCSFNTFGFWGQSSFERAKFTGSEFREATIGYVNLKDSVFDGCSIKDTWFNKIGKFIRQDYGASVLDKTSATNIVFRGGELTGCTFEASNLMGMAMEGVRWDDCEFKKCNAQKSTFERVAGTGALFHDSFLQGTKFDHFTMKDITFHLCQLRETSWANTNMDCHFIGEAEEQQYLGENYVPAYTQFHFDDALTEAKISRRQFEFLVLSGVIEVRDNVTLEKVTSGFDPDYHHVPPWCFANLKNFGS